MVRFEKEVINDTVSKILEDKLGVDDTEVITSAHIKNDLGADSLDCIEVIMECEKEYSITIPDNESEEIFRIGTVGALVDYLDERLNTVGI